LRGDAGVRRRQRPPRRVSLPPGRRARARRGEAAVVLDDRVRAVLARLEAEDAGGREQGVSRELRGRQVARTTGQFLFALVAPQTDCEVLEIGGSRGYSTIWLAAAARYLGGHVLSLESDPRKTEAWRTNIASAGLDDWADLVEGNAHETLAGIDDVL